MSKLLGEFFINSLMRKNKRNLRNLVSIVNPIVNPHLVRKWASHRKPHVVLTKIVISKFAFFVFFTIINLC